MQDLLSLNRALGSVVEIDILIAYSDLLIVDFYSCLLLNIDTVLMIVLHVEDIFYADPFAVLFDRLRWMRLQL